MGKALAKINAAWTEHVDQVGDTANYGSFLAGWVSAEETAQGEVTEQPQPLPQFKAGDRIVVGDNPNFSPVGPGTLVGDPQYEGDVIWWEFNPEGQSVNWWVREDMLTLPDPEPELWGFKVGDRVRYTAEGKNYLLGEREVLGVFPEGGAGFDNEWDNTVRIELCDPQSNYNGRVGAVYNADEIEKVGN